MLPRRVYTLPFRSALLALLAIASGFASASASDDGVWRAIPPAGGRLQQFTVYDPLRDRLIVGSGLYNESFGTPTFKSWTFSLAPEPQWHPFHPANEHLTGPTGFYDPAHDRVVTGYSDVLELAGAGTWTTLTPVGTPPASRAGESVIFDQAHDRTIIFGGYVFGGSTGEDTLANDVLALEDLSGTPTWVQIVPAGTPPVRRSGHTAIWDSNADRMIVFGGKDSLDVSLDDVWALSLSGTPTWTRLVPAGPPIPARSLHAAVFDPVRDRMLVLGGDTEPGSAYPDTSLWSLSLGPSPAWSVVPISGAGPDPHAEHTLTWDPVRDRVLLVGGQRLYGPGPENRVLALDLAHSTWSELSAPRPSARCQGAMIYDAPRQRVLLLGGRSLEVDVAYTWTLSLASPETWAPLAASGAPAASSWFSAIRDPARDRVVVFGIGDSLGMQFQSLQSLSLTGSPAWSTLAAAGTPPAARYSATAIYDPVGDRMILFGGVMGSTYYNDVWQLTLSAPVTWTLLHPSGTPPDGRYEHTAIYDPDGQRMLVYGGHGAADYGDLWELTLGASPAWHLLAPGGTSPSSNRYGHLAVHDPNRHRMLVFGGGRFGNPSTDTYALSLNGPLTWTKLAPTEIRPNRRCDGMGVFDPVGNQLVIYGGQVCNGLGYTIFFDDAWSLAFGGLTGVPPAPREALALTCAPNPSSGDVTFSFSLDRNAHAWLAVYDLAGRRRAVVLDAERPAGGQRVAWTRAQRRASRLGPGVYFFELRIGDRRVARRLVVTD